MNARYHLIRLFVGIIVVLSFSLQASDKSALNVNNCSNGQSLSFTMSEIKALPSHEITTRVPWDKQVKRYRGVYLNHVISLVNSDVFQEINVHARNIYNVFMSAEELNKYQYMLAYTVDKKAITIRQKGPLILVRDLSGIAMDDMNALDIVVNLVWFVETINIHCGTK